MDEIHKLGTRGWTENFFTAPPDNTAIMYSTMRKEQSWVPVGRVHQQDPLVIETRNVLEAGDSVEYLGRTIEPKSYTVTSIILEDGSVTERANPGSLINISTEPILIDPELHCLLRKKLKT